MSNKTLTELYAELEQASEPVDREEILDRIRARHDWEEKYKKRRLLDLEEQFFEGELDNPDLCFTFAAKFHQDALESFKEIDAKRSLGAAGGKASGSSRRRVKEAMGKNWLDIAEECKVERKPEDPDLTQADIVARIMETIAAGEEGYRRDVGGDPIFGKSTIAAFLKENLK